MGEEGSLNTVAWMLMLDADTLLFMGKIKKKFSSRAKINILDCRQVLFFFERSFKLGAYELARGQGRKANALLRPAPSHPDRVITFPAAHGCFPRNLPMIGDNSIGKVFFPVLHIG